MSKKDLEDKDDLLELIKKLWLPIAGFLGAVSLAYNFYQLWLGDQETITYIMSGAGLLALIFILTWVGFKNKTVEVDSILFSANQSATKKIISQPAYAPKYRIAARIGLVLIFIGAGGSVFALMHQRQVEQQNLGERMTVVIATFEGPEEAFGLRNEIIEYLDTAFSLDKNVEIVAVKDVVTPEMGDSYARTLGEKYQADLVIWGWYRPTENPNITIHIENLSPTQVKFLNESEIYKPQATLAQLESFEIQEKIGSETSTLIASLMGVLKYQSDDYESAMEYFEQVLETKDISTFVSRADLYFYLGSSNKELKKITLAIQDFDKAIELDPKHKKAYENRGVVYGDLGQYQKAIQDYDRAVELDPEDADIYSGRAMIYFSWEQYERAIQDFDKAIDVDPDNKYAYTLRGMTYGVLDQHIKAIQDCETAIEIDPEDMAGYFCRGAIYGELEQYERAIQDYSKGIELGPKQSMSWAYYQRGYNYNELGQYKKAIRDFDKAIELDPENTSVYNSRGSAYDSLMQHERAVQDYDKAIQDYDKAIELDPKNASAYIDRGIAYAHLEQYEKAIQDYDKAIELDTEDPYAYYGRGIAYDDLGQYERAIQDYDIAIELDPEDADTYKNRGFAYQYLEQHERAIQDFNKAIELDSEYAPVYLMRGFSYLQYGKVVNAGSDLAKWLWKALNIWQRMGIIAVVIGVLAIFTAKHRKVGWWREREGASKKSLFSKLLDAVKSVVTTTGLMVLFFVYAVAAFIDVPLNDIAMISLWLLAVFLGAAFGIGYLRKKSWLVVILVLLGVSLGWILLIIVLMFNQSG